jgi:hypothetical protein
MLMALGAALCELAMPDEGLPLLERAVAAAPDAYEPHFSRAVANLAAGNFAVGWREFVHRPTRMDLARLYPQVEWRVELPENLHGKHVCVQREQGLGDQLFFLRFAPALKARGARITFRSPAKIASLFARAPVIDDVVADHGPLPPADYLMLVSDLPVALLAPRTVTETPEILVPPPLELAPLQEQLNALRERLAQSGPPPYVGLTWRGGITPEAQHSGAWMLFKEIGLDQFAAALHGIDATLLALQRNPVAGELERLSALTGKSVHDYTALNEDLEAMLALLALIDDYVGVSNTNMHLRAAAGKTARVLVPCPAEWRWMLAGKKSPWFPGFTVYRQSIDGKWGPAMDELSHDLKRS